MLPWFARARAKTNISNREHTPFRVPKQSYGERKTLEGRKKVRRTMYLHTYLLECGVRASNVSAHVFVHLCDDGTAFDQPMPFKHVQTLGALTSLRQNTRIGQSR